MRKLFLLFVLSIFCNMSCTSQKSINLNSIDAYSFIEKNTNIVILDVRTAEEFNAGHIKGAINIDIKKSNFEQKISELDTAKTYLVYCRSGKRSSNAVKIMDNKNFKSIYEISDGFLGWSKNRLPFEK